MSLTAAMNIATSGLMTAQGQIRVTSDNVANVNTAGYIRKVAEQQAVSTQGVGSGVEIAGVRLATDRFLQAASYGAGAEAAHQGVRHELYERIQSLFGDPGGDSGFFGQIDSLFSAFSAVAETAASPAARQTALYSVENVFGEAARIQAQIEAVRQDADQRIHSGVDATNTLLEQIDALNKEIVRATATGADVTGAQNAQTQLIGRVAELMDIQVSDHAQGGVSIRTGGGALLVGDGHATLVHQPAGADGAFSQVYIVEPSGLKRALSDTVSSGEIAGLLEMRDVEAPAASASLADLTAQIADALNAAHNANSSVPAPSILTGRDVGESLEAALAGFGGSTTLVVLDGQGVVLAQAALVFSGEAMTVNGETATPSDIMDMLNQALGGTATVSFDDGALILRTTSGDHGVAVVDDPAAPSSKDGRGFSHYFGLNDLVSHAAGYAIRADIRQDSSLLALAQVNLDAPAGTSALSSGDGRGASLLSAAGVAASASAADLAGEIGAHAAAAQDRQAVAQLVYTDALARRQSQEGVNLDEELVWLTTYQQAFAASARLIQVIDEMYDTLMDMVR